MENDDKKELTDKPIDCLHCGNTTLMYQCGKYNWDANKYEKYHEYYFFYEYEMFACPVCEKITLLEKYGDEDMVGFNGNLDSEEKIIYPINTIDSSAMPTVVKKAFESALKVRNVDDVGCLMLLRHTLEVIVKEQGAVGGTLAQKIENIANRGILPDTLKEASTLTRLLGNEATHEEEITTDKEDIDILVEFVEYIIQYLYIIPKKIEDLQMKRNN